MHALSEELHSQETQVQRANDMLHSEREMNSQLQKRLTDVVTETLHHRNDTANSQKDAMLSLESRVLELSHQLAVAQVPGLVLSLFLCSCLLSL